MTNAYLPPEISARLKGLLDEYNQQAKILDQRKANVKWRDKAYIAPQKIGELLQIMEGKKQVSQIKNVCKFDWDLESQQKKLVTTFAQEPDIKLTDLIRFFCLTDIIDVFYDKLFLWSTFQIGLRQFCKTHNCRIGQEEVAAELDALGAPGDFVGWTYLDGDIIASFLPQDDLAVPHFIARPHIIEEAIGMKKTNRKVENQERRRALEVLSKFPEIPPQFTPTLWDIAFTGRKPDRPWAMACLNKLPDTQSRLLESLNDPKQEIRAAAAEWLGSIGAKAAVPALQEAMAKEQDDIAKASMIDALDHLGLPMEQFLNRDALAAEAKAAVGKGIPDQISWFDFDGLPVAHWQDTGQEVPKEVPTYWILQNLKYGDQEPGALLMRYASLLETREREAFGEYVMNAWIARDTKPLHSQAEAAELAQREAAKVAKRYSPAWVKEYEKQMLDSYLGKCIGAPKEKGILAVAAACGGASMVPTVESYLKKWYSNRSQSCRALLRTLSWVDDDKAVQYLLSVANKFRTPGIREEALQCAQAMAERKGWTLDELADRTIPTAGFDENREMVLDYGSRTFTAKLDPKFEITLYNAQAEVIKSLPDAAKDDDSEKVKEAKKSLADAKKELKTLLTSQRDRLYEAMCVQRTWNFKDWNTYLNNHPIVRYYCQSLVWQSIADGKADLSFRPLDDSTLTDSKDNAVNISDDTIIRLAHCCNMAEEEQKSWLDHFAAYQAVPLFEQFSKPMYELPENLREESEIKDFDGHLVNSYKLKNAALKQGYLRGEAEEGSWFTRYRKPYPGLNLEAQIEFTGNTIPEEDRLVALRTLSFYRKSGEGKRKDSPMIELTLEEIPPVLLSKCWNDLRIIASEGTGYDPEWEKKTEI